MDPKLVLHGLAATVGAALASGQLTPGGSPPWLQLVLQVLGMALTGAAAKTYDPEHLALNAKLAPPPQPPEAASIKVELPSATATAAPSK